jgi:hypothetical protein
MWYEEDALHGQKNGLRGEESMSAFDLAWTLLKQNPFSMKRPDMVEEARGIMDELARREFNRGDDAKDFGRINYGEDDDSQNITPDMVRMKRPEMEKRLLALQTELARRGRPLVGEKFRDLFESEQDPATGKDRFYMDESGEQLAGSQLAENMNLVDAMGDKARANQEHERNLRALTQQDNQALLDKYNEVMGGQQ